MVSWRKKLSIFSLYGCLAFVAGCSSSPEQVSSEIFAMDTLISLDIWSDNGKAILKNCENYLYTLENEFSTTLETSEIYQANHNELEWSPVSESVGEVLVFSQEMYHKTKGAFDPSIYPIVKAWGFTQEKNRVPSQEEINVLLPYVDILAVDYVIETSDLYLPTGMELDFGSVAKGYAVDRLAQLLKEENVKTGMISLGGNIYTIGKKIDGSAWNIGIQNPYGGGVVGSVQVFDKAIITSGGYQRYFTQDDETYWHILDPRTGYPADSGLASVTIISDSGLYGDCLSTAFFVLGLEEAIAYYYEHQDFDAVFISTEGDIYITPSLNGVFQLTKSYTSGTVWVIPDEE